MSAAVAYRTHDDSSATALAHWQLNRHVPEQAISEPVESVENQAGGFQPPTHQACCRAGEVCGIRLYLQRGSMEARTFFGAYRSGSTITLGDGVRALCRRGGEALAILTVLASWACSSAPADGGLTDLGVGGKSPDLLASEPVKVTVSIDGMGRVTSMPAGIDCPGTCSAKFLPNVKLWLNTTAAPRMIFTQWSGACAGANPACVPTLHPDLMVTAHFGPRPCSADGWCSEEPLPMEVSWLNRVWGSSDHDVWAVGSAGVVVHYTGDRWYRIDGMTTQNLVGLWGSSATDIWAVGTAQTILRGDGTSWGSFQPGALPTLFSLWGASKNDVWAFGGSPFSGPFFVHFTGDTWQRVVVGGTSTMLALWGGGAADIWGVGSLGAMLHYTGSTWQPVTAITNQDLNDVWGSSAADVWAVGNAGTVLHYDGTVWQSVPSGTTANLRGIWGSSGSFLWAVGDGGTMLRFDGGSWKPAASGTTQMLRAVWGSDEKTLWAVGDGVILRYLPGP